jgi:mono/diheme cytochrome c family protein
MNRHRIILPGTWILLLLWAAPAALWARTPWLEKVPPHERERQNRMAGKAEAVSAGRLLFEEHCAKCHGADADGKGKRPSLRTVRVQEKATPGDLHWLLRNGNLRRGMPSWSKLPDPQLWQIVTFVRSLKNQEADPSPAHE